MGIRTPFVGIGTGRCGTTSLTRIVDACENTHVAHEAYQFPWYEVNALQGQMITDMQSASKKGLLAGNVGQAYGPHIGVLRSAIPDMKVVCLHREKEATVESFMNLGSYMIRPDDKRAWVDNCWGGDLMASAQRCFPLIDAYTVRQSYEFYWEFYHSITECIAPPVIHISMEALNNDGALGELFDFLEIPEVDRVLIDKRKHYSNEEIITKHREATRGRAAAR